MSLSGLVERFLGLKLISTLDTRELLHLPFPNVKLFAVKFQMCVFRYWIVTFPAEFNLDLGLIRITEEFRHVAAQLGCEEHFKFIDISTM